MRSKTTEAKAAKADTIEEVKEVKKEIKKETKKEAKNETKKATAAKKAAKASQKTQNTKGAKKSEKNAQNTKNIKKGGTLIVVESPTKASTLRKILGNNYSIEASIGHVRDLPKARLGLDMENNFNPEYILVRGKAPLVKNLKNISAASDKVYLASDPDREGEAIAWHLAEILSIDPGSLCRIKMHEITKSGVQKALQNPQAIDMEKVNAQQSRRVLDRLVGYKLSPLLWNKIQKGLSAGRVQSVALKIVCERETEIENFIPQEYWLIDVTADGKNGQHILRVERFNGKGFTVSSLEEAQKIIEITKTNPIEITVFVRKETARAAMPPFKTSTLQQESSKKMGYAPRRTMRIAQSLYEGVEIPGKGPIGLITYMRTDSLRVSDEAIAAMRTFIGKIYGQKYLPEQANNFSPKGRSQDAHEAIRPTDVALTPDFIKPFLTPDQHKVYSLIWNRTVASQMSAAVTARTTLDAQCGEYGLRQSGIEIIFDGWGKLWPLGIKEATLPAASEGDILDYKNSKKEQKFTQPPARFTEAGLIKVLEEKGIGRPSTYATIVETLTDRGYTDKDEDGKKLVPTELGKIVNGFLAQNFPKVMDVDFTANMETELDSVESGDIPWLQPIQEFWSDFEPVLEDVSANAKRIELPPKETGEACPNCGKPLVEKRGRFGDFIACSGYPECKFTKNKIISTGIKCPQCSVGELTRRKVTQGKSKGRYFYGCTKYPDCNYLTWNKPKAEE